MLVLRTTSWGRWCLLVRLWLCYREPTNGSTTYVDQVGRSGQRLDARQQKPRPVLEHPAGAYIEPWEGIDLDHSH